MKEELMKKYVAIVAAALVSGVVLAAPKGDVPVKVGSASAPVDAASAPVDAASAPATLKKK
ncbi:hypothetical protein HMPREF9370_2241 [Neisseria wadsworthii 9715]|uniref:Uncharacterized protein n=2 Tax=Neisseriaceae TaxID=481 RepID=G4CT31_9NEIS|nr:hypothetical protein HMPREF9370_2241 [Neisseria wadsworthii 9715]